MILLLLYTICEIFVGSVSNEFISTINEYQYHWRMKNRCMQVWIICGMHMPSHITVHLLVSLENASQKFGTKCELHYSNYQGTPQVRRSYQESRTRQGQTCSAFPMGGERFKRYIKNCACSAPNPKIELSCLSNGGSNYWHEETYVTWYVNLFE
jgi:hypothetical protein